MPTTDNNPVGISRRSVLKTGALTAGGLAAGVAVTATPVAATDECPRTPGFWKNHPDAWPTDTLWLGGDEYTKAELIDIMSTPARGRKWYILARAAIAAKLNYWTGGALVCPEALEVMPKTSGMSLNCDENSAGYMPVDCWLHEHDTETRDWDGAEMYKDTLDAYNNGRLCEVDCESTLGGPATPANRNGGN